MNNRASILLSALILSPIASFAQEADPYHATFGNYQLGDNIGTLMESSRTTSAVTENIWGEISKDPKAMCKQVALGKETNSSDISSSRNNEWNRGGNNSWNNKNHDTGNNSRSSQKSGNGGGSFLGISLGGGGGSGSNSANAWNKGSSSAGNKATSNSGKSGSSNSSKISSSKVVIGSDCTALIQSATSLENNRMNNDTRRLDILVGNETQRYGIDKQHQVAIKQIEAGQIQSVFGGGAKAMMGSMGQ